MRSPLVLLLLLVACRAPEEADTDDSGTPIFDDDLGVVCPMGGEALPDPPTPVPSFPFLPTSNGWVSAQYVIEAVGVPVHFLDGTWTADDDADHVRPGQDLGREYQGAVPMGGFGPGAYILALEALRG